MFFISNDDGRYGADGRSPYFLYPNERRHIRKSFTILFMGVFKGMLSDKVGLAIMVVCLAPLLEEVLFRGIIQGGLTNKGVAPKKAIVISALVFGIVHANPWQFVGVFIGVGIGISLFQTESIVIPILLHA